MKLLTIKSGALLTVVLLALTLVSCTPYSSIGVSGGYGAPYGGYYGYRPYGYGYGYGYRPPVIIRPPVVVSPRPYYYAPRTYGPRSYGGGGGRGYSGGRRR